jgi:methyl-accepting chemotaxis protein
MGLVKKSKLRGGRGRTPARETGAETPALPPRAKAAVNTTKASERIAAATEQLASGLAEAATAAEELRRSMEQISRGAEEAASASQEQLGSIQTVSKSLQAAREQAETSRRRTQAVQSILAEAASQIALSVRAVERNAERQIASTQIIDALERSALEIAEVAKSVSGISDQTNLLALNAAIEAARAGDHGRGFAVVAEEVRALAETSEKSAGDVQTLAGDIQSSVQEVAGGIRSAADMADEQAKAGGAVAQRLDVVRQDMVRLSAGSEETLSAAFEAERASAEAQRGAEQVASAAEEQSAAANEAQAAVEQQAKALEQGQAAAQELSAGVNKIAARQAARSAEEISTAAEELSGTIQELSGASTQITAAIEQINRGAEQQSAATHQTSAALGQIESSAKVAQNNASEARQRIGTLESALKEGRAALDALVAGVATARDGTRTSLETLARLEGVARRIEKIVDGIGLVAMQTTMLAVSGSVEAARAGAAGRGFSVVSKDIRALAQQTSGSIDSAKDTVRGILALIASLQRDLDQTVLTADREIENNAGVVSSLAQLDADVLAMRASNDELVSGAEMILNATTQMADAGRQIAAAAEEASNASRQAATAAAQQAQGAEDLAAAIEEIASLAETLKQTNG